MNQMQLLVEPLQLNSVVRFSWLPVEICTHARDIRYAKCQTQIVTGISWMLSSFLLSLAMGSSLAVVSVKLTTGFLSASGLLKSSHSPNPKSSWLAGDWIGLLNSADLFPHACKDQSAHIQPNVGLFGRASVLESFRHRQFSILEAIYLQLPRKIDKVIGLSYQDVHHKAYSEWWTFAVTKILIRIWIIITSSIGHCCPWWLLLAWQSWHVVKILPWKLSMGSLHMLGVSRYCTVLLSVGSVNRSVRKLVIIWAVLHTMPACRLWSWSWVVLASSLSTSLSSKSQKITTVAKVWILVTEREMDMLYSVVQYLGDSSDIIKNDAVKPISFLSSIVLPFVVGLSPREYIQPLGMKLLSDRFQAVQKQGGFCHNTLHFTSVSIIRKFVICMTVIQTGISVPRPPCRALRTDCLTMICWVIYKQTSSRMGCTDLDKLRLQVNSYICLLQAVWMLCTKRVQDISKSFFGWKRESEVHLDNIVKTLKI